MTKKQIEQQAQRLYDKLVDTGMYDLSKVNLELISDWLMGQDISKSFKEIQNLLEDYLMSQGLVEVRL